MRTFVFKRNLTVEEIYSVQMSDKMANPSVARSMLMRQLANEQLTDAVKLTNSQVINTGRIGKCL
jgi:hypothetical protein